MLTSFTPWESSIFRIDPATDAYRHAEVRASEPAVELGFAGARD
jgi:hypothetical protein